MVLTYLLISCVSLFFDFFLGYRPSILMSESCTTQHQ